MDRRCVGDSNSQEINNLDMAKGHNPAHLEWPLRCQREPVKWSPARYRLIDLVRSSSDAFVLPPAVIRKALWRE